MKIQVEEVNKVIPEKQRLDIGDIVITGFHKYLTLCDGYGRYCFLDLHDGFIVAKEGGVYIVSCKKEYSIGEKLIEGVALSEIKFIVKGEDVKVIVRY